MGEPVNYSVPALQKSPELLELAREFIGVPWCEEYEKMISGVLYDPFEPILAGARHRARGLAADYNQLDTKAIPYEDVAEVRLRLLRKLVGRAGENTFVEPPFMPDYGCNISLGKDTFVNFNLTVLDTSLVVIGDRVFIGTSVSILTVAHETSIESRRKMIEFGHPVFIGDDCWIGSNVVIMPGVTIGEGSTVGAGSVVTKSIRAYSVAYGNPCRVHRTVDPVQDEAT